MKKWWIAAFTLLLLAGCGGKNAATVPAKTETAAAAAEQSSEAESGKTDETAEPAEDGAGTADKADAAEDAGTDSPAVPKEADADTKSSASGTEGRDVENNGGNFVRVGHRVYFRNYANGGLPEIALFGDFLTTAEENQTSIWYYDEETGETSRFYDEKGYGPLWYGTDGFYLTGVRDGLSHSFFYPDGAGAVEEFGPGLIEGVSEDGHYAAFWSAEGNGGTEILSVIKDAEVIASVQAEDFSSAEFCGMVGPKTIWLCHGEGEDSVWEFDGETEKFLCLGLVPAGEGRSWAEMKQFVPDGEDFYLMLGWYEGTGHFLADFACMKGTLDKEDSLALKPLEGENERSDPDNPPKILLTGPGEVMAADKLGGEVELSDFYTGDLVWYDSPLGATRLIPGFIEKDPYDGGDRIIQASEAVGDAAYVLIATVERSPEDDIGWRTAYRQTGVEYLRVPLQENSTAEHLLP